jgi:hypothetical protein
MDTEDMAGVAGLPEASNINGCDGKKARKRPAKTAGNPAECRTLSAAEQAARRLTAKVPSLPEAVHPFAYTAIEQLHNMDGYVPGPWVSDERQTLPYQLKKSLARLGG